MQAALVRHGTRLVIESDSRIALQHIVRQPRACYTSYWLRSRGLHSSTAHFQEAVPLRKHLKDERRRKKDAAKQQGGHGQLHQQRLDKWELTVGIEIHAQLNTATKLFSHAPVVDAGDSTLANDHAALFDAAMPGSQPRFQVAALLPAMRAALALGCTIQPESRWDRKHYFHWDQPNGYQITQYYRPFATNGEISLSAHDGVAEEDLVSSEEVKIGIKQVQMEQDTAKTTLQPSSVYHIDLNRAGHALIEIITLPQIHSPQTAAAVVRKIQTILKSVNACDVGMELGGLRADVNVSIRERGTHGQCAYSGVSGLGQRTEIKNLSSFQAVEDAIVAERNRQIAVLEAGGMIEGETRGWTLGSTETTRLRGKEGEVDYRYIPDADLAPLLIDESLIRHINASLPPLHEVVVNEVERSYGITSKDAKTLASLDDGDRLDFMEEVVELLKPRINITEKNKIGKLASNWVLHELGGILAIRELSWANRGVQAGELADILHNLHAKQITARSAKQLLAVAVECGEGPHTSIEQLIEDGHLRLRPLSDEAYTALASSILAEHPDMVDAVRKGQRGKIMWFVGQMVRKADEGTVEPEKAREVLEKLFNG